MSAFAGKRPGQRIEKIMTLSRREFNTSIGRLMGAEGGTAGSNVETGSDAGNNDGTYDIELGGVSARICVEAIEPILMGGLVKLPRCRVVIEFGETTNDQRLIFLNRFDQAFQRGGG